MRHSITLLIAWVVIGSLILTYYQYFDGNVFNKPLTFYVDTQALKTDKTEYHIGDTVSIYFDFCRHRSFTTTSQWKLVNEIVIFFPEGNFTLHPECQHKYVAIGIIPPFTVRGQHHLEGTTAAHVNPLHTIYYTYKTNEFNVI